MLANRKTCFIVEDNENDLEIITLYIDKLHRNLDLLGHATSIIDGIDKINLLQPEILFMDVEITDGHSFNILDKLTYTGYQIIIMSAHNQYALDAFSYNSVSYLVKPISFESIYDATEKAILILENSKSVSSNIINKGMVNFIAIGLEKGVQFIKLQDVEYCEADGRYTIFHLTNGKSIMASRNLGEYEKLLPLSFFRIHNKYIINLNYAVNIDKGDGNYFKLQSGKKLPVARRKYEDLRRFLLLK